MKLLSLVRSNAWSFSHFVVTYEVTLESGQTVDKKEGAVFVLGEGQITIPGLEKAIMVMQLLTVCLIHE